MLGVVEVFLTNGNGVCFDSDPITTDMIRRFDPTQAQIAIHSFMQHRIASKLQFNRCRVKFREMLDLLEPVVTAPVVRELIQDIRSYTGPMERMREVQQIQRKVEAVRAITG